MIWLCKINQSMDTSSTSDTRTRTSGIKRPRFDTQNAIWYPKHLQIYHCPGFRNNFGLLLPALAQHFNAGRAEVVLTSSFLTLLILGSGQLWDVFVNLFTIDGGTLFSYGIKQLPFVIMMLTLGPLVATLLTFFSHQKVFNVTLVWNVWKAMMRFSFVGRNLFQHTWQAAEYLNVRYLTSFTA